MNKMKFSNQNEKPVLEIKSPDEVIPLVKANAEKIRSELNTPTKAEVEDSDSRLPTLMCDPFLEADDFLAKTKDVEAILIVTYASGAMPNRLVSAIQQRISEDIPVFALSNNPGDNSGIVRVKYEAGSGNYKAGMIKLQKVNVNQHEEVKVAILERIESGLNKEELAKEIEQLYAYKKGEKLPVAEWDDPNYVAPPKKSIKQMLREGGFVDDDGNYTPPK